ncbi:MAG TPA: glycosyltransferase family 4 protein [Candidatus Polarisedimenticolia bacterium]|jgi:glycosyltransferase involved in cell wall biosynthesis
MKATRALRVMHVVSGLRWGGRQMQAEALATGLAAKGHHPVVAALAGSTLARRAEGMGIELFPLPSGWAARLAALRRLIGLHPWDVAHLHDAAALKELRWASLGVKGPPGVLTVRGDVRYGDRVLPAGTPVGRVARFIAVSEWVWSALVRAGISEERIAVIHTAVDLARFTVAPAVMRGLREASRGALGLGASDFVAGTVVSLRKEKGIADLIEAGRRIREGWAPSSDGTFRLVIAGEGPCRADLEAAVRRSGMADAVIFTGWRDEVLEVLAALDVFVHPALSGGAFPLSLREAMAMGVPVVATDLMGIREIIDNGKHGLIAPAADPEGLALNIMRLQRDPAFARELGRSGSLKVQRYGVQAMVDRTEELYFRLVR